MSPRGRKALPRDLLRGACMGALFTLPQMFALYVAIHFFEASATQKAMIASAQFVGGFGSLYYTAWAPVFRSNTRAAAAPFLVMAGALIGAASAQNSWQYTLCAVGAGCCPGVAMPFIVGLLRANYREIVRGQVFGLTVICSTLSIIVFGCYGSGLLDSEVENFRRLYLMLALVAVVVAVAISHMPSSDIRDQARGNPFRAIDLLWKDRLFGYVIVAWFIFGFSHIMIMPQRIETLVNGERFAFGALITGLIMLAIPEVVKLMMIPIWARLFDRINFITLRIVLNTTFIGYYISYYLVDHIAGVIVGSILFGASVAGGSIAWTLWVTKFAPPEKTSTYMSIHTLFTGLRGVTAPFIGYALVGAIGVRATICLSIGLGLGSIWLLYRIRDLGRRAQAE